MQNKILNNYNIWFTLIIISILFFMNDNTFGENMQEIILKVKNKEYEAVLYDNSATRELIKIFPITITMSDLHEN